MTIQLQPNWPVRDRPDSTPPAASGPHARTRVRPARHAPQPATQLPERRQRQRERLAVPPRVTADGLPGVPVEQDPQQDPTRSLTAQVRAVDRTYTTVATDPVMGVSRWGKDRNGGGA